MAGRRLLREGQRRRGAGGGSGALTAGSGPSAGPFPEAAAGFPLPRRGRGAAGVRRCDACAMREGSPALGPGLRRV